MPKHTYTATYAGQTFTRKSDRIYTHVVIATPSLASAIAHRHEEVNSNTFARNYAYFCREADKATRKYDHTPAEIEKFQKIAAQPFAEYRAARLAEWLGAIETERQKGFFEKYQVVGWAGRPDLAQKSAASAKAKPWNADVKIVPVTA